MIQKKNGFTLIEILVVVAIIAIFSAIVIPNVNAARIGKQVEANARSLASALREAQNHALAGERAVTNRVSCSFSFGPSAASVTSIARAYQYRNGATCAASTRSESLTAFSLTQGVRLLEANVGVRFKVPWGEVWNGTGSEKLGSVVRYTLAKSTARWSVCVYPEGRIEEVLGSSCP
ncbi:MAG: prepilin-type N-terminal cleavage/methylation domain-containing protein [Candidatus Moranbacteria bacterium]|nr:prepilin-type N-terminal cleavage/methylation domain-containing protein [Candidatus Moranbacteria bacterium]